MAVAESTVRLYVRERKAAMGLLGQETFVPQSYTWGGEAQVDWYEGWAGFDGESRKAYLFCLRSMASGGAFHRAYPHANQQAFLEAHELAFAYFGGVFRVLRPDFVPGNKIVILWRATLCGGSGREPRRSGREAWMTEHNSYSESSHLIRSASFRHPPVGWPSAERSTGGRHAATAACLVRKVISA